MPQDKIPQDKTPQNLQDKNNAAAPPKEGEKERSAARFFREIGSAVGMALIAIVYVIQAFQIPTGSMEDSLVVGDFLLGLKFVYGAPLVPFSQELGVTARFPAVRRPRPGDVVIFKYPGADSKDYIKRMVAGPGDVIEIVDNETVYVNGLIVRLPPRGKYTGGGRVDRRIVNFAPLYIPAAGDTLSPRDLPARELMFLKNLIHQENPTRGVHMRFDLYVNGVLSNDRAFGFSGTTITMNELQAGRLSMRNEMTARVEPFDFNRFDDWTALEYFLGLITAAFDGDSVYIDRKIFLGGEPVDEYAVRFDNYFMIGDNRDNSLDSRYWGYLNYNYVKAKAFILYFSYDGSRPFWNFLTNIRWDRIGKLIRDWDGLNDPAPGVKY